jgi:tRNA wybutosine-synthesizing protein 4
MRNTKLLQTFLKSLEEFSDSDPTFLLSEVVLTYMSTNSCNRLIKWIAETFHNCVLAAYEQIHPFDGFGQIMFGHFKKLGSPLKCILKYPTEQDQIVRYKSAGFVDCTTIKAINYYRDLISDEEKARIDRLELFDEFEPWHLKCAHYTLLTASKGPLCTQLIRELHCVTPSPNNNNDDLTANMNALNLNKNFNSNAECIIKTSCFPVKFGIRFGHSISVVGSKVFVFGGFGERADDNSGKHKRLTTVEIVDLNNNEMKIIDKIDEDLVGGRVFHTNTTTCCANDDEKSVILTFGRTNPGKLFDSIIKIKLASLLNENSANGKNAQIEKIYSCCSNDSDAKLVRFRHAASLTSDSKIFVYGGKYFEENSFKSHILSDAFIIEINQQQQQQQQNLNIKKIQVK